MLCSINKISCWKTWQLDDINDGINDLGNVVTRLITRSQGKINMRRQRKSRTLYTAQVRDDGLRNRVLLSSGVSEVVGYSWPRLT